MSEFYQAQLRIFLIKFLCVFVPFKSLRRKLKGKLADEKKQIEKHELKHVLNDEAYDVFYPPPGFGDILLFCALAKSFKRQRMKKFTVLVKSKPYYELVHLFEDVIDECHIIKELQPEDTNYYDTDIYNLRQAKHKNMAEAFRFKLGLPANAKLELPSISISNEVSTLFEALGLKQNKVVYISCEANTCPKQIPDELWREIGVCLTEMGYDVVFNSPEEEFYGFKTVFLSLKETIEFSKLCGNFIGYRSGLCDVICSFNNLKALVIYPNFDDIALSEPMNPWCISSHKNESERYRDCASIKDMYRKDMEEVIFRGGDDLTQRIQNYFGPLSLAHE